MTDTVVTALLNKGTAVVAALRDKEMDTFANALELVLDRVGDDQTAVETLGWEAFEQLLQATRDDPRFEATVIKQMGAQELIDDMNAGAEAVKEETAELAESRRKVKALLLDLGRIGVNILLAIL